ncbi:hypothetical protein EC988_003776, partial [Linderina pennispora]
GANIQLEQFVEALDPASRTVSRLMAAMVKEAISPRRPSEPGSPAISVASMRGGHSPAVDGSGVWLPNARRSRSSVANVDLDHVRNLMEAIEIVSPNMVGADIGVGSPIPEMRSGWSLPRQAHHEQMLPAPANAGSYSQTHALRHRRTSVQMSAGQGIPIRPSRSRNRSSQIDPLEFAEYAVAHMRPSPRFTPMGHGFPLSSSATSESRSSLPRSFLAQQARDGHMAHQHPGASALLNLPRQHGIEEARRMYAQHASLGRNCNSGLSNGSGETSPGSGRSSLSPAMHDSSSSGGSLMNGSSAMA